MSFEPNVGQVDPAVKFLSHGANASLFLTPEEAVLAIGQIPGGLLAARAGSLPRAGPGATAAVSVVRMRVIGANASAVMEGVDPLPGVSNYFIGRDSSRWRRGVSHFGSVRYRSLLPGIDMIFHGRGDQPEYDLQVGPGVDPGTIAIGFSGARLRLDADGGLVMAVEGGILQQPRPTIYQEIAGSRQPVSGGYVLSEDNRVQFAVGAHDRSRPLIIDPALIYSTYLGGSGMNHAAGVGVDSSGAAYILGQTTSLDFPTTSGSQQPQPSPALPVHCFSRCSLFVAKLDPTQQGPASLRYATYLSTPTSVSEGGNLVGVYAGGIAVDVNGNAYITGTTGSADFPTTAGAFQRVLTSPSAAFVSKLDSSGSTLMYSSFIGGLGLSPSPICVLLCHLGTGLQGNTFGHAIAADQAGHAFVTGRTSSQTFPVKSAAQPTLNGASTPEGGVARCGSLTTPTDPSTAVCYDAFVTELDTETTGVMDGGTGSLVYSTYLGGTGDDSGTAIALDTAGNAYVAGDTRSNDFPTSPNAYRTASPGPGAGFLTKVSSAGSQILYSTYFGGTNGSAGDGISGVAVDTAGHAYLSGTTSSPSFPTLNAAQANLGGDTDGFVAKFDPLASSGPSSLLYSTYLGGSATDGGTAVAVDSSGDAWVTGATSSANFPVTVGALQPALQPPGNSCGSSPCAATSDAFISEVSPSGLVLLYSSYLGSSADDMGTGITLGLPLSGSVPKVYVVGDTFASGVAGAAGFPTTAQAFDASAPSSQGSSFLSVLGPPTLPPGTGLIALSGDASVVHTEGLTLLDGSGHPLHQADGGQGGCEAGPVSSATATSTAVPPVNADGKGVPGVCELSTGGRDGSAVATVGSESVQIGTSGPALVVRSRSNVASVHYGPIDASLVDAQSSSSCTRGVGARWSSSSIGRLTVAGVTVATRPVGSRIVFNPTGSRAITLYGNPISINPTGGRIPAAIVTLNYTRYDPATSSLVSSPAVVDFPARGPLSSVLVGRVFISFAQSGVRGCV